MTNGCCFHCGETYTKRGMNRHLRSCLPNTGETGRQYLLRIEGTHRNDYWIHVIAARETTLATLDSFLRDFWVECCQHLSTFEVGSSEYDSSTPGPGESEPHGRGQSMAVSLGSVLDSTGIEEFSYIYDWGSSTHLTLSVVEIGDWELSAIESAGEKEMSTEFSGLLLVTRNEQPSRECGSCGDQAEWICQSCLPRRGPEAMYCEACADEHDCERPRFLPVVNSPRSGVCGYTG